MAHAYERDFENFFNPAEPRIELALSSDCPEVGRSLQIKCRVVDGEFLRMEYRRAGELAWIALHEVDGIANLHCEKSGALEIRGWARGSNGQQANKVVQIQVHQPAVRVEATLAQSVLRYDRQELAVEHVNAKSLRLRVAAQECFFTQGELHTVQHTKIALPTAKLGSHALELLWEDHLGQKHSQALTYIVLARPARLVLSRSTGSSVAYQLENAIDPTLTIPALQIRAALQQQGRLGLYLFELPSCIEYTDEAGSQQQLDFRLPAIKAAWPQ